MLVYGQKIWHCPLTSSHIANTPTKQRKEVYMLGLSWVAKSLIATLCLVPLLLAIGFLGRNYQVRAEATMIWYFFGIVIGALLVMWRLNIINGSDLALTMPHFAVLLMGMVLGVASNILLFQAIPVAPNPGLPMAFVIRPLSSSSCSLRCLASFYRSTLTRRGSTSILSPASCLRWWASRSSR